MGGAVDTTVQWRGVAVGGAVVQQYNGGVWQWEGQ